MKHERFDLRNPHNKALVARIDRMALRDFHIAENLGFNIEFRYPQYMFHIAAASSKELHFEAAVLVLGKPGRKVVHGLEAKFTKDCGHIGILLDMRGIRHKKIKGSFVRSTGIPSLSP